MLVHPFTRAHTFQPWKTLLKSLTFAKVSQIWLVMCRFKGSVALTQSKSCGFPFLEGHFAHKTPENLPLTNQELSRTSPAFKPSDWGAFTPPAQGANTRNKYPATNNISHLISPPSDQPLSHPAKGIFNICTTSHGRHKNLILGKFNW